MAAEFSQTIFDLNRGSTQIAVGRKIEGQIPWQTAALFSGTELRAQAPAGRGVGKARAVCAKINMPRLYWQDR